MMSVVLRRRRVAAVVLFGVAALIITEMLFSGDQDQEVAKNVLAEPVEDLSADEVLSQLKHALSPANQRARCRSTIFPGGKCQCVDATPDDDDSCLPVPVLDGKKTVCLDDGLLPPGGPCLVYSFGVRDDLSFETEMVRFGCTVHAFDPTVRLNTSTLPAGLHVHYIGADGRTWTHRAGGQEFQLMTLNDLVRHLGHEGRRIDYMKLDVEGSEWSILRDQLGRSDSVLRRLPQFTLELHLLFPHGILSADSGKKFTLKSDDATRFLRAVRQLESAGFSMLESRPDFGKFSGTDISLLYETTWMRWQQ